MFSPYLIYFSEGTFITIALIPIQTEYLKAT